MDEEIYFDGFPQQQGWYDVKIDGKDDRLRHWVCSISGRHEWMDRASNYVRGKDIKWCGTASVYY